MPGTGKLPLLLLLLLPYMEKDVEFLLCVPVIPPWLSIISLPQPADVYLIDEPSAYLDSEQRIAAAKVIKR